MKYNMQQGGKHSKMYPYSKQNFGIKKKSKLFYHCQNSSNI